MAVLQTNRGLAITIPQLSQYQHSILVTSSQMQLRKEIVINSFQIDFYFADIKLFDPILPRETWSLLGKCFL